VNLNLKADEYTDSDQIRIDNGHGLSIKHVGNTCLFCPKFNFDLLDVLHVPQIFKNLLLVHKFTKDNNTFSEFHPYYFLLKDCTSGRLLVHGPNKHVSTKSSLLRISFLLLPWWVRMCIFIPFLVKVMPALYF
jgi:hypothetical protein